jgi:hypothetical protein
VQIKGKLETNNRHITKTPYTFIAKNSAARFPNLLIKHIQHAGGAFRQGYRLKRNLYLDGIQGLLRFLSPLLAGVRKTVKLDRRGAMPSFAICPLW